MGKGLFYKRDHLVGHRALKPFGIGGWAEVARGNGDRGMLAVNVYDNIRHTAFICTNEIGKRPWPTFRFWCNSPKGQMKTRSSLISQSPCTLSIKWRVRWAGCDMPMLPGDRAEHAIAAYEEEG